MKENKKPVNKNLLKTIYTVTSILIVALAGLVGLAIGQSLSNTTFTVSSGPYPGAPNYTVYAYNTTHYAAKNQYGVNFWLSSNATYVLQTAIDSGAKVIYISAGTYSGLITVYLTNGITLRGDGINSTTLNFNLAGAQNAFQFRSPTTENQFVTLIGFKVVDTNRLTIGTAFYLPNVCNGIFHDINIVDFRAGIGMHIHASDDIGCYWNDFSNVRMDDVFIGFELTKDTSGAKSNMNKFTLCRVNSPSVAGSTIGTLINYSAASANSFDMCDFSNVNTGMVMRDSNDAYQTWFENSAVGVDVHDSLNCYFIDCIFANTVTQAANIIGSGGGCRFQNCYNYVSENSSAATILAGDDSVTVLHGLRNGFANNVFPTRIQVTAGDVEGCQIYVFAYNTTAITFKINGTATVPIQIWWDAKYIV